MLMVAILNSFAKYHISSILSLFTIKVFNCAKGTLQYLSFKSLLINIGGKLLELLTDKSGPVLSEQPVQKKATSIIYIIFS